MKSWTVGHEGGTERTVTFHLIFVTIILSLILYSRGFLNVTASNSNLDDVVFIVLTTAPIWGTVLIVTLRRIVTSKIPSEITINEHSGYLKLKYSEAKEELIPLDHLAYSLPDKATCHPTLILYTSFQGSRGEQVYKKIARITGMRFTLSWTASQVQDLIKVLGALRVDVRESRNKNSGIFNMIIAD